MIGKGQMEAYGIHHNKGLCDARAPVATRSFEHHSGDSTIWPVSPNFEGGHPGEWVRGLPLLFLFYQPHERTGGYLEYPHARRHYTFTNIRPYPGFESRPYGTTVVVGDIPSSSGESFTL
ncbi:hypothetical protein TNCV_327111 [Trichonephila clavipes]|nr:hypothetical protein TNCV_327111 [Trichonephila clavipes]